MEPAKAPAEVNPTNTGSVEQESASRPDVKDNLTPSPIDEVQSEAGSSNRGLTSSAILAAGLAVGHENSRWRRQVFAALAHGGISFSKTARRLRYMRSSS
jgi:hypothetical protein